MKHPGIASKYIYDEYEQCFRLKKLRPLGMSFPYDFGMIKGTSAADVDPVDAMVITECDTYPGVQLNCRVIGALLASQTSPGKKTIRNDRYFFIPEDSVVYEHITDMKDFPKKHNDQLEIFFINYNKAENKKFVPLKLINAGLAKKIIGETITLICACRLFCFIGTA